MSNYNAKAIEEWHDYRGHDCTDYSPSEITGDCEVCGDGPMEHDTTSFALMAKAEHERAATVTAERDALKEQVANSEWWKLRYRGQKEQHFAALVIAAGQRDAALAELSELRARVERATAFAKLVIEDYENDTAHLLAILEGNV